MEIDKTITSMNEIRKNNIPLIKEYGRMTFAVLKGTFSIEAVSESDKKILVDWDKKKELLKHKLRLFFQLRFNPDLEISGSVLDSLDFKKCKQCHGREQPFSF